MAVGREEWEGLIRGRADPNDVPVVDVPLQPSPRGGSGTFLAEASDNQRWWVKPQNNLQGAKVVVTEYVVGSAGRVIEAPVCEVKLARIPPEIAGWEFRPGGDADAGNCLCVTGRRGSLRVEEPRAPRAGRQRRPSRWSVRPL